MGSSGPKFPPVRACLFDMDGLLINSEDIYTRVANEILHEHDRPSLPWSLKAKLQGRPGPAATGIFMSWAKLPITKEDFLQKQDVLMEKYFPTTQPLPGVVSLLSTIHAAGIPLALASGSTERNFKLKTSHLPEVFERYFPDQALRVLGDDPRIASERGKPAPDIYLAALEAVNAQLKANGDDQALQIRPEECLVFEDAVPGVEAGRRAGMRVVWCPHPQLLKEFRGRETEVLAGRINEMQDGRIDLAQDEEGQLDSKASALTGWPSKVGDGWAELVDSLEHVDLIKYGISV